MTEVGVLSEQSAELEAIQHWHHHIQNGDIRSVLTEQLVRLAAAFRFEHRMPIGKGELEQSTQGFPVIRDQDRSHGGSHFHPERGRPVLVKAQAKRR